MAESVAVNTSPEISRGLPSVAITLATTEDSPASLVHQNTAGDLSQFAKPANLRKRQRSPQTSNISAVRTAGLRTSPAPISPKFGFSSRYSPAPLTGAAAMAAERRQRDDRQKEPGASQQTPNPARTALGALLGEHGIGMSKPYDAPSAATTMSEPMATVAKSITIPDKTQGDSSMQTSPVSISSFSTLDSTAAATATAISTTVASPGHIGEVAHNDPETPRGTGTRADGPESEDGHSNKAFTFPGPLLSAQVANDARRGMSLPHPSFGQESPRSASTKKHKCPYCSTDFTRHHNLKSHLLTHSHEKPYMCQTCEARFRRLHDLKRHTKLHTGERPHVCPKCNRSFARGDALARHNKGQGGCAGRRSSMGSFGGDDQYGERSQGGRGGDESMDGLIYTGQASHEPEHMDDDDDEAVADDRRKSLPSIRKHDAPPDPHRQQRPEAQNAYQSRQPSTYPPVAARQSTTGGLYPPSAGYGGGSGPTSPSTQGGHHPGGSTSSTFQIGGQNIFSPGSITESPKPLSPGAATAHQLGHPDSSIHRNRSPSLTTQFQQDRYGRRTNTRNTPPPIGLPPPLTASSHSNAPQLPSLPGLTPPDPRFTLHSQSTGPTHVLPGGQGSLPGPPHMSGTGTPSSYHSQQGNVSSNSNSHSSHGTHAHVSGEGPNNPYAQTTDRLWAYVQSLEAKVNRLHEEVVLLRNQLPGAPSHR